MTESTLWVIEVALRKRKLVERSEEEGFGGDRGFAVKVGMDFLQEWVPFLGGFLTAFSLSDGSKT